MSDKVSKALAAEFTATATGQLAAFLEQFDKAEHPLLVLGDGIVSLFALAASYEARIAALEAASKPAPETAPAEIVTITTVHYMTAIRSLREALRRAESLGELEIDDLIGAALTNLDPTFYNEPPF